MHSELDANSDLVSDDWGGAKMIKRNGGLRIASAALASTILLGVGSPAIAGSTQPSAQVTAAATTAGAAAPSDPQKLVVGALLLALIGGSALVWTRREW